ncbi:MAG: hypothetical protein ACIAS6_14570 [Phycisphaerales bacterium JB060]
MSKQIVLRGYDKSLEDQVAFQYLGTFLNQSYAREDLEEAVTAFKENRKPSFRGR